MGAMFLKNQALLPSFKLTIPFKRSFHNQYTLINLTYNDTPGIEKLKAPITSSDNKRLLIIKNKYFNF